VNVWAFLAGIAVLAALVYLVGTAAIAHGGPQARDWSWWLRSATPGASESASSDAHRAALPAAIGGWVASTTLAAVGGILHGGTPLSAPWTLAALVTLGISIFIGSFLTSRAAARIADRSS